jgi:hypothetical protein
LPFKCLDKEKSQKKLILALKSIIFLTRSEKKMTKHCADPNSFLKTDIKTKIYKMSVLMTDVSSEKNLGQQQI